MALPRRRVRDDELPDLPPLDGDDAPADLDVGADAPPDEGDVSLDDAAADELTLAEVDEPADVGDDGDAPVDVGDDAEGLSDGDEGWRGDAEDARGDAEDVDELDELPPDDGGVEGVAGDPADDLGELPPLDDDAGDEGPAEADAAVLPRHAPPTEPGVEARVLTSMASGAAPGVCVGVDHVFAAGDRLLAWPTALLDDPEAAPLALDAPGDEVLCAVSEDAARTLTVADHDGALWRRARARDPWRRLHWTDDDREGPVTLDVGATALWALSARGSLRREAAGHFADALAEERVRAVSVDAHGGAAAAVSGRRRDGVRVTDDAGRWAARPTPEALDADAVARAGDVLAVAGAGGGFVSADGGARWAAWHLLAGATALCVGEADDGDARVFAAVADGDRALLVAARVATDGSAESSATLCDVTALVPRAGDDDEPPRVERLVAVDRAGRRLLAAVSTGEVLLVTRRA